MQANNAFDAAAANYDEDFTYSLIGIEVRKIIHKYLAKNIASGSHILEINCGSGEDAFFLAGLGCKVMATDVWFDSEMMHIRLLDSREISIPLEWFPILREATNEQRLKWRLIGKGVGIHWEELDEDISVAALLK